MASFWSPSGYGDFVVCLLAISFVTGIRGCGRNSSSGGGLVQKNWILKFNVRQRNQKRKFISRHNSSELDGERERESERKKAALFSRK